MNKDKDLQDYRERADALVRSFETEGYKRLFKAKTIEHKLGIKLRHKRNGNALWIVATPAIITICKNGTLIKQIEL